MRKLIIPVIAILMAIGSSAFTAKKATSNFYKYVGPTARSSSDVQNINNYIATAVNPCSDAQNVCGITLTTPKTLGQTPATAEFNPEKSNLWLSQQQHSPADASIDMEP